MFQLWPSVTLDKPCPLLSTSGISSCSWLILNFFCFMSGVVDTCREPWLLWMVIGTRIWGLGVFVAAGLLLLPSQQIELGNTCVHTNYRPTLPPPICIWLPIHIYENLCVHTDTSNSNTTGVHLQPPLFICNFSLYSKIKGFHFLWYIICSGLLCIW